MEILLPNRINAEHFLPFLALLSQAANENEIVINFGELRRVSPAGLVSLTARVRKWASEGRKVSFRNLATCPIAGYLQRMDLFKVCGLSMSETFARHEALGRFVPIRKLDVNVNEMGHEMALCVAPGGDDFGHSLAGVYDLVWYVFTEMANNARQHSGGIGYASAQVQRTQGMVQLAIGDNGKGVRQSFIDAGLQWAQELDDVGAIKKAMEPFISSKGNPTNEGVGLSLTAELARQARAWLLIASGQGAVILRPDAELKTEELANGANYPGTLVGMTFKQSSVPDFATMLHNAKEELGLLQRKAAKGRFSA